MRPSRLASFLLLGLATGACLDTGFEPEPVIEETTFAAALGVNLAASTRLSSGMYIRDVVVGTGAQVALGNTVRVYYTGWLPNGTKIDERIAPNTPFGFVFGVRAVILGWDLGLAEMRVGGVRQLIIPPRLGYGPAGFGSVPGNSILVFTVEVVAIE